MKLLKKIGITILCLLLICGIGIVCLFHNEYSSLKSLKKIDAYPMYTMDYSSGMVIWSPYMRCFR